MLLSSVLLVASAQVSPTTSTGLFNAGQLKDKCESAGAADISYCFAYIVGAYDTVRAYEAWLNLREFCAPADIAQGDLRRAFVDYLSDNPGYRSGEAASVVVVALKKRYACVTSKGKSPTPRP